MGVYVWACMCVLQARTVFQHAVRSQFQPGVHVVLYRTRSVAESPPKVEG